MCFVRKWNVGFLGRWIALWLSQWRTYLSWTWPNSCKIFLPLCQLQMRQCTLLHLLIKQHIFVTWIAKIQLPLTKVVKYPDVGFLESTSPAMSASAYPTNTGSSLPKHKHLLVVPLKYLNIHFTVFQCSSSGLDKNRLTTPTAWAIFGLVQIMVYIRLPTTKE